jgi:two-component system nitrate/nitrite response regulator NarL
MSLRVLIVDDHPLFRAGLLALIAERLDMRPVGEARDAAEACRLARALQPDVVLLEALLPGRSGIEVLQEIRAAAPHCRVLILSAACDEARVADALTAGASGYLHKSAAPQAVIAALLQVAAGRRVVGGQRDLRWSEVPLSRREREVLGGLLRGESNEGIAESLSIRANTVRTHRSNVFRKLGVHSMADLLRWAARNGGLPAREGIDSSARGG